MCLFRAYLMFANLLNSTYIYIKYILFQEFHTTVYFVTNLYKMGQKIIIYKLRSSSKMPSEYVG